MSGYVIAGYGITVVTLAAYSLRVVLRGRALVRALPPEQRP
ncbi:MAG TPA: hypothetical protein VNA57_14560 [Acidimicrobiales bacterium]|nr:hypothetical protein [Acidimicrobiales bacterium]